MESECVEQNIKSSSQRFGMPRHKWDTLREWCRETAKNTGENVYKLYVQYGVATERDREAAASKAVAKRRAQWRERKRRIRERNRQENS
jgi:hypothetical protein